MKTLSHFRILQRVAVAALALALFITPLRSAKADTVAVIPPRFELFGNPGDTIQEKLRVRNDSDTATTFGIQIEDFKAQGDEGGVTLIAPDDTTSDSSFRLAKWITTEPSRFTIGANTERVIDVTIKIPRDAEPGGHFASVLVRRGGTETDGGAAVDTRVGSLFLLRVSGNITEAAAVDSFRTEESFAQYGPVTFALRTKNEGNVHVAPKGRIVINNIFGRKVSEIPLNTANVLPGSARIVRTVWDEKNLVGRYTATLFASYGQQGVNTTEKNLTATTSFIIFPLYLLWIIIAVIVALFLFVKNRKQVKKFLNKLTSD